MSLASDGTEDSDPRRHGRPQNAMVGCCRCALTVELAMAIARARGSPPSRPPGSGHLLWCDLADSRTKGSNPDALPISDEGRMR
ncbi:hypothetical protein NL676_005553 [Syzygium grande]|nr:hypothetical protein NL676_005553 [Syzygium grande]